MFDCLICHNYFIMKLNALIVYYVNVHIYCIFIILYSPNWLVERVAKQMNRGRGGNNDYGYGAVSYHCLLL